MEDFRFDLDTNTQTRSEVRKPLKKRAQLSLARQAPIEAQTIDISLGGISLIASCPVPIGQACSVTFDVFFKDQSTKINLEGKVVYCLLKGMEGFRTGIRITQLDPEVVVYLHSVLQ
jgi:hypothetical protein